MKFNRQNPLTVIELFSGYGSQRLALGYLKEDYPDFDFKVLAISEIEPAALKAYRAIHGDCPNLGDITRIDWADHPELKGVGLATYSFPCQDISNAGKQKGFARDSGSRSSLLWECEKCFRVLRPKMLLLENVKALVQKKFMPDFKEWLETLDSLGYTTYWKVLNAKDYNEPQNRERVFAFSILREEADPNPVYNFPAPMSLTLCVEDMMVPIEEVPEDAYISQDRVTGKVLKDILDQPNVRAEMEKLYHEEWKERMINNDSVVVDTCPANKRYLFYSVVWDRYEEGSENLSPHFDIFRVIIKDGAREISEELKIDVWYRPKEGYSEIVAKEVDRLMRDYLISNHKELEDEILTILYGRYSND